MTLEGELAAFGLRVLPGDLPGLAAVVAEIRAGAELLRGTHALSEEPAAVFRLEPARDAVHE